MNRCKWCDLKNPKYVEYHDKEWGVLRTDDSYLFEMLVLESFQAGLSWECILNKRENFRRAYDEFDLDRGCGYDEEKIAELCSDSSIVRNKLKIRASISNARIFRDIVKEQGSFSMSTAMTMVNLPSRMVWARRWASSSMVAARSLIR